MEQAASSRTSGSAQRISEIPNDRGIVPETSDPEMPRLILSPQAQRFSEPPAVPMRLLL